MSTRFRPKRQVICEACGRQCQTRHRSRDICNTCLKKEPSALCISCGNKKHLVSKDTGLCPRCADLPARPTGECARCSQFRGIYDQQDWLCEACAKKARRRIRGKIKRIKVACSVCGKRRPSVLFGRAICQACYAEERNGCEICAGCNEHKVIYNKAEQLCNPCYKRMRKASKQVKVVCTVCGKMRISALFGRAICRACYVEEQNGWGICTRCKEYTVIRNKAEQLCRRCNDYIGNTRKQFKVACSVCGKMRVSFLFGRAICRACHVEERNGWGICARCNRFQVIYHAGKHLCNHCHRNNLAPGSLRRYIGGFTSPYPYNTVLFNLLATKIDWNAVDQNRVLKFRVFGRFLQTHKFDEPLTWGQSNKHFLP